MREQSTARFLTRVRRYLLAVLATLTIPAGIHAQSVTVGEDVVEGSNRYFTFTIRGDVFDVGSLYLDSAPLWFTYALNGGSRFGAGTRHRFPLLRDDGEPEAAPAGSNANDVASYKFAAFDIGLLTSPRGGYSTYTAWSAKSGTSTATDLGSTPIWKNVGGDTSFNSGGNWDSGAVPTDTQTATFLGSAVTQPVVTTTVAVGGIAFGGDAGVPTTGYNLSSSGASQLAVRSGGIVGSNTIGTNTVSASLVLNADQSITQAAGGTLNITGPIAFGGGTGTTTITIGNATTSQNGTINFSPASATIANDLRLVTNVDATIPGFTPADVVGAAASSLTKAGSGTLTITGGSGYIGGTVISAGTLLVTNTTGSATGSGGVTVSNTGTLGGTGRIDAPSQSISVSGTLAPGADSAGTLTLNAGALTLNSGSVTLFDLGTAKDLIALGGSTSLTVGGTLTLNLGSGFSYGNTYTLFNGIDGTVNGAYTAITGYDTTHYSANFFQSGSDYNIAFADITGTPEPATWASAAFAAFAIGIMQRRRIRSFLGRAA